MKTEVKEKKDLGCGIKPDRRRVRLGVREESRGEVGKAYELEAISVKRSGLKNFHAIPIVSQQSMTLSRLIQWKRATTI